MLLPGRFNFITIREIGTGGLGTVEEIQVVESNQSHAIGTRLALKRLNNKWKDNPTVRIRFEREIAALSKMSHDAIVRFEGENIPNQERFYVMPLYPRSLRDWVRVSPNGEQWRNVARFAVRITSGLAHAHVNGFYHRDLKPENILLDGDNIPVISDWGLGYFVHKTSKVLDLTVGGMGTEYYCSYEQWLTGKCVASGDVYSLGVMLAELCRGNNRVPMEYPGAGITTDVITARTVADQQFNAYMKAMTAVRAENRPQTMAQVGTALNQLAAM